MTKQQPRTPSWQRLAGRPLLACLLPLAIGACGAPEPRDPLAVRAIESGAERFSAEQAAWREAQALAIVERMEAVHRGETSDDTFDALFFSGGAEWGAFGAGYAAEWKRLGSRAAPAMPEFDMLGGISTGALMAAYVASGSLERHEALEGFYRTVSPDWLEPQLLSGLLFRNRTAIVDNSGLRRAVEAAVDDSLVAAREARRGVYVGTLNLDYLAKQYWNVAEEAAGGPDAAERIVDILMASTAIPVVFPPVEIDGVLHADLGAGELAPVFRPEGIERFAALWRNRHGEGKPPVFRAWIVYNVPLGYDPDAVERSLLPLAYRGWESVVQSSAFTPLETFKLMERFSREHETPRMEVRWIAIPSSWRYDPDDPIFDPAITNELADLGQEMARQPGGGWRTDIPGP